MFDLDETLTPSKRPMEAEMLEVFSDLLSKYPVAITSGASLRQIGLQVLDLLPVDRLKNMHVFPTGGAAMFVWDGSTWKMVYEHQIEKAEADEVIKIVEESVALSGLCKDTPSWGERVEWRGSQITFSGLGQEAPYEAKAVWDPDKQKRLAFREVLMTRLPKYDVVLGGTTSVDIIPRGINKAYGVKKFAEYIGSEILDILYVGDDLKEGGNDYVVAATTNAQTKAVISPKDTYLLIKELIGR